MSAPTDGKSIGAQVAAGAFWNMLGFASKSICGYIIAVLLARGFGPVAYGVYGVVYSVLLASEQVLRLGIPQALTRLVGGGTAPDQSALESAGIWLGFAVSVAGFAVLWFAAPLLADWLNVPRGTLLFRIAILDIPFFGLYRVMIHVLSGRRDFAVSGIVHCVYAFARAAGIAVLFATDNLSIEGALIVNVAASILGVLLMIPRIGWPSMRLNLAERATIVAAAVPIMFGDVGIQGLLGIDLWLLSAFSTSFTSEARGVYVAAMSMARGPNILAFVLVAVLVPLIARARSTGEDAAARKLVLGTTRFLMVLLVPVCALLAVNAGEVMVLFFGEGYRTGAPYLALLIFAQGMGFTVLSALQAIVIGVGHAEVAAHRIYAALAIAVVLNLILIPTFGAAGAATAALLSFAIATILIGHFVRREMGVLLEPRQAALTLAVTICIATLGWIIPSSGTGLLAELLLLGAGAVGAMRIVGLIVPGDIALLLGRKRNRAP